MDCPGPSLTPKGGKKKSDGGTLAEKAAKFIAREGEKAICTIDSGSGCTYIQRRLDINNFVRHFRTRHVERASAEGLQKDGESLAKKPRIVPKRPCAIDKQLIVEVSVKLVANHNLPVSCFEWEAMHQLYDPLMAAVGMSMDTRILKGHVTVSASMIKDAITNEMKGLLVSLKIDSASRHNRHVLAILVRYMIDGRIASRTLGVIEVKERQTAGFLKERIMGLIQTYGLTLDQIFSITVDNGANMLAAVRQLKQQFEANCLSIYEYANESLNEENETQQELLTAALSDKLQEHLNLVRCAVHTLQLAILDVVNKSNKGVQKLTEVAKKCKSVKYCTFFELHGASYPPVWGQTRWGGIYLMISKFLEQKQFFEQLAEQFQELGMS